MLDAYEKVNDMFTKDVLSNFLIYHLNSSVIPKCNELIKRQLEIIEHIKIILEKLS